MQTQNSSTNYREKNDRLEARTNREIKLLLEYAAELEGTSLSDFLIKSAKNAANEVIREHQIIQLSTKESRAFAKALFKASKPNTKLKSAYSGYKKQASSDYKAK
ncbi:MAG: hypothetical protein UT63_C0035G0006 [Candidatus Gottesmanbacteria bacterium GW2011_GWC2_39_8]|uniref:DUF1778 domain-containing protein n=1 Tax=Candidatus Gottesmanbacteria bacterium GW2011_GWC2_39_8 TaxID=1618450 RepID=A0A0G0PXS3_9BACT|nr:MAG: hypothetical protein UT63_C0035G0006 [Candidatus Gottesmanbacteria bacterium GW2011_GWC2_39_8]